MGRLTKRNASACRYCKAWCECLGEKPCYLYKSFERLKHYEELEEQGRLIEQKQGEWKPLLYDSVCSACGYSRCEPLMIMRRDFKYCPNCGAKMELKELEGDKE